MRIQNYPLPITLFLLFVVSLSCRTTENHSDLLDSSDSIQPLPKKNVRHAVCGVERYKSKAHQLCGVQAYKAARTNACGVELYNQRADFACPGAVTADEYNISRSNGCPRGVDRDPDECRTGYYTTGINERKTICYRRDMESEIVAEKTRHCKRDQVLPTCRLAQFGVERYKSCRHQVHGVESYKSCARPEFGVDLHKQCQFYLLPAEIDRYLASVKELLPFMGETLLSSKAKYFLELDDEASMSCHIKKYDTDPLYVAQMGELKTLYTVRFGRSYDLTRFDCNATVTPSIDQEACLDSDSSRKCTSVRSYRGAKKWLTVKSTDLSNLQNDIAAKSDQRIKAAVKNSLDAVEAYKK